VKVAVVLPAKYRHIVLPDPVFVAGIQLLLADKTLETMHVKY
jgi:hypothetical protein